MAEQLPSRADFDALRRRILDSLNADIAIAKPYRTRRKLAQNYHPDWAVEWFEISILMNCSLEIKPAQTHNYLGKLRAHRSKRSEMSVFDEFMERIDAILHPKSVTPHGYTITFDQQDSEEIFRSMARAAAPLSQLEKPIFLYAGALLGYIRSGGLIGHDDDLDFGVFLGECSAAEAGNRWLSYKRDLADLGLIVEQECARNSLSFKLNSDLPVDVDLFPAWSRDGKFSVYPYSLDALNAASVFPLKSFGQDPLMLPADPEAFLIQSYGEDWRVPDPLFHLNWPRKKREFEAIAQINYSLKSEMV